MPQRLLLLFALTLWVMPAAALELPGTCQVQFTGSSSLHDFTGTATCTPFVLKVSDGVDGAALLANATLTVPVADMQTGNSSRDKKMREMFDAGRFPQIAGTLAGGSLARLRRQLHDAAGGGTLPLQLRLRDSEAPVAARVTRLVDSLGELSFDLEFPVSLAAYRLEPPSVLGLIKVADEVRVRVSLRLAPLPTP